MPVPDLGYCDTLGRPLDFDNGTLEGIYYTEGTVPPAVSTDVARSGTYSLKCTVASGVNRSLCDYANTTDTAAHYFADASEAWFAFDMYVSDFTAYNSYNNVTYWSHNGTLGTSGFGLRPVQNTSNWEIYYNAGGASTGSLGAMVLDTWERWVLHVKFDQVNTVGEINVWRDGTQIVTALKPSNGTYDEAQGVGMTWRLGFNRDAASTTLNTVYFDNIAVGTTRESVEDTALVISAATVTVAAETPDVTTEMAVEGAGPAEITVQAYAPTLSGDAGSTVDAPAATAAAQGWAPQVLAAAAAPTTGVMVFLSTTGSPTHFPSPSWTEVTSRVLAGGGVTYAAGVSGRGQEWSAGQFSFTLRNTDGAYSGPMLLRRPVLLRVAVGASTVDVRGVVTDVTELREGVRRLQVSGTDVLGLMGDLEVGETFAEQLVAQSAKARWQLTADGSDSVGSYLLSQDPPASMTGDPLYGGDQSGQLPTFAAIDGCPALSGGGVTLEPVANTGFCGLYTYVPASSGWHVAGWMRRMSGSEMAAALTVVLADGYTIGVGFGPSGVVALGGDTVLGWLGPTPLPAGLSDWYWVTLGVTTAGALAVSAVDVRGTVVGSLWTTISGHDPLTAPVSLILGGPSTVGADKIPAHVQIADLVWAATEPPATDRVSPLIRGHIGYAGETAQARALRLLKAGNLAPAGSTWNGTTPPEGPTLADHPWTRRPLADAVTEALDSAGMVIHDLPVTSAGATSLGLLWPDTRDGYGVTPITYSGTRVLVASDGVTTNTGMLTNAATVTHTQTQEQVSYEDTASVTTYGRRATTVATLSTSFDYTASLASWSARRSASPAQALGMPDLVLDVNGMVADGDTATVLAMARTGAVVSVTGIMPGGGNYGGVVRGLQWEHTAQGVTRLTLRCQPLRPLAYALLDDTTTATLDNVIIGW